MKNKQKTATQQLLEQSIAQLETQAYNAAQEYNHVRANIEELVGRANGINLKRDALLTSAEQLRKDAKKLKLDIPEFVPPVVNGCCEVSRSAQEVLRAACERR